MANLFNSWLLMSSRISSHPTIRLCKISEYIKTAWYRQKTESVGTVKHMEGINFCLVGLSSVLRNLARSHIKDYFQLPFQRDNRLFWLSWEGLRDEINHKSLQLLLCAWALLKMDSTQQREDHNPLHHPGRPWCILSCAYRLHRRFACAPFCTVWLRWQPLWDFTAQWSPSIRCLF